MDLSFVGYQLNCFDRSQTDFALCGGRQGGSAPLTPASLSGKRLDLNPLPLCLFVQTFSKQLLFHYRKVGHFSEICVFQISEKCPIKIPIFGFNT